MNGIDLTMETDGDIEYDAFIAVRGGSSPSLARCVKSISEQTVKPRKTVIVDMTDGGVLVPDEFEFELTVVRAPMADKSRPLREAVRGSTSPAVLLVESDMVLIDPTHVARCADSLRPRRCCVVGCGWVSESDGLLDRAKSVASGLTAVGSDGGALLIDRQWAERDGVELTRRSLLRARCSRLVSDVVALR